MVEFRVGSGVIKHFASLITVLEAIASVQYEEIVNEVNIAWLSLDFQLYLSSSMFDIVQCLVLLLRNGRKIRRTWVNRTPNEGNASKVDDEFLLVIEENGCQAFILASRL